MYVCMYVCMSVCTYVCIYIYKYYYMCVYTCVFVYTSILAEIDARSNTRPTWHGKRKVNVYVPFEIIHAHHKYEEADETCYSRNYGDEYGCNESSIQG